MEPPETLPPRVRTGPGSIPVETPTREPMTGSSPYLLALYLAERRESGPIAPGDVADAVGRSPSATTEMLQRLEGRGLVTYEPYEGATLTPEGRRIAEGLHETYVTLSRFLHEVLELDDHEVEAMRLAETVSPVVAERLASTLLSDETPDSNGGSAPSSSWTNVP